MTRRLAAILAADVVGYSRLMEIDEGGTLASLKAHRAEFVDPLIAEHGGRIVKLMGDGALVEFPSVVDAVECSIKVQTGMVERNADIPDAQRIVFRIGVNLGDIIIDGNDIYGDGVNVAARVESLAEPGGIALSSYAHDQLSGKVDIVFEDSGEHELKNILRPIRVWRWPLSASGTKTKSSVDFTLPTEKPSIAVLPFTNMSGDTDQEYFSDGLTEDLITELSRFRDLSLVSRNSSFVFKGQATPLKEVGEKLNANYIVEGSVRKAGNRIRVTAQLIDAKNDNHVWAERYDRDLEDIFQIQDDVVRRVASSVAGRLEYEGQKSVERLSGDQLRAYDLYLRGREHFFNWSIDENRKAHDLLRSALSIEPDYAAALALLSEVLLRMWLNGWSDDPEADLEESLSLAVKADALDSLDSRTQTALGIAYLFQRQLDKARYHFEQALTLNPNDMRVLVYFSRYAVFMGDTAKAIELCEQALSLNPYGKYYWNLGLVEFVAHRYQEAVTALEKISNPTEAVLAVLAASHALLGNATQATANFARFSELAKTSPVMSKLSSPEDWREFFSARWPFRDVENLNHLLGALAQVGLPVK